MKQYVFTRSKWIDRIYLLLTSLATLFLWGASLAAILSGRANVETVLMLILQLFLMSLVMKSIWVIILADVISYKKEWIVVTPHHIILNMYETYKITWKRVDKIAMCLEGERENYLIRYRNVIDGPQEIFSTHTIVFKKISDLSIKRVLNIISLMAYMDVDEREALIDNLNKSNGKYSVKEIIMKKYKKQYSWSEGLTFDRNILNKMKDTNK